ncbi:hypothetical protein [Burkholderia ubonensis]|uniref:hypothetical protein n=1 Tax=Burkholderia ubonensis TaxID=101571 RepID=UPI0012FA03F9|nr:hypothetical protein [Burkholderia ubonensis]
MSADFQPEALHLMLQFSNMTGSSQQRFISLMNQYLFASPSRRKAMKNEWGVSTAAAQLPKPVAGRRAARHAPLPGTA